MSESSHWNREVPVRALAAILLLTGVLGISLRERALVLRSAFEIRQLVDAQARASNELAYAEAVAAGLSRPSALLDRAQARGIRLVRIDPALVFDGGPAPAHRRAQ